MICTGSLAVTFPSRRSSRACRNAVAIDANGRACVPGFPSLPSGETQNSAATAGEKYQQNKIRMQTTLFADRKRVLADAPATGTEAEDCRNPESRSSFI